MKINYNSLLTKNTAGIWTVQYFLEPRTIKRDILDIKIFINIEFSEQMRYPFNFQRTSLYASVIGYCIFRSIIFPIQHKFIDVRRTRKTYVKIHRSAASCNYVRNICILIMCNVSRMHVLFRQNAKDNSRKRVTYVT